MAGLNCTGLVQTANDAPSSEHSRCSTPAPPVSLPENPSVIDFDLVLLPLVILLLLPSTAVLIVVMGGTVSTVQLNDAGDGSLFADLSSDITLKICVLSVKFAGVNCTGLVQTVNDAPSNEHSRCSTPAPPVSLPANVTVA